MKILHIGYSDTIGGAARAMRRLHIALQRSGVETRLLINFENTNTTKCNIILRYYSFLRVKSRNFINRLLNFFHSNPSNALNSHAILPSRLVHKINTSDADIVHLHWINGETLSIRDITKIQKPIVWTFHDMWPICGSEHVSQANTWKSGYNPPPPPKKLGLNLDRWTWNRKYRHWKEPLQIVTPSTWLNDLAAQSPITKSWPCITIKNPIDTDFWHNHSSHINGLQSNNKNVTKILFGSLDPEAHHKGGDLFWQIFDEIRTDPYIKKNLEFFVLGGAERSVQIINGFKCTHIGHINSDENLRKIYSGMDAFLIPSRIDNLPNMAVEALSCGLPIIGFATCGLVDVIDHRQTGYLAEPFEVHDLAEGIRYITNCSEVEYNTLSINSRQKALAEFSENQIANQFISLYNKVYEKSK